MRFSFLEFFTMMQNRCFFAPTVVWLLVNVLRDAKARRELRLKGDETLT